jgi:hypothetical protein
MENKPSRPKRARKKPLPKVSKPEPLVSENDIARPTPIVGNPTIGVDPNFVESVGLGKLKVVTAQGIKNDGKTDV